MIQDIPDVDWMLRDDVQWAYKALIDLDLTFDALGFPPHLANFNTLLRRYPELRTVVDHCLKPRIRDHAQGPQVFSDWAEGMSRLAETGACCKLSGLVTEAVKLQRHRVTPDTCSPPSTRISEPLIQAASSSDSR